MDCNQNARVNYLHSTGKARKLSSWVPQALSENVKNQRSKITVTLLAGTAFSLPHCHWQWKMVLLSQYEAVQRMAQPRQTSDSVSKTRPSYPKDHVVCMVRLGRHNLLRTAQRSNSAKKIRRGEMAFSCNTTTPVLKSPLLTKPWFKNSNEKCCRIEDLSSSDFISFNRFRMLYIGQ